VVSSDDHPSDGDEALLRRVSTGDGRALGELYARHGGALLGYLLVLLPDRGLAEEVLQDTLVAAWRGTDSFAGRSSVKTWLFGIARRRARDARRRRRLPLVGDEILLESLAVGEPGPEETLIAAADGAELRACISRLGDAHQETVAVMVCHGLSYAEAAEVLAVPVGTVKSRLSNARKVLRALLLEGPEGEGT